MEFVIVTGLSGAGKSRCISVLEDIGFYCVDNMPPALLGRFAEICYQTDGRISRVALVADARGAHAFERFFDSLDELKKSQFPYKVLFLDAADEVLINRYKETRRRHPLGEQFGGSIRAAIEEERRILQPLREKADSIIDTSHLSPTQLRERLVDIFMEGKRSNLVISVVSFGFKYGLPTDADLVFDVRCLPNPFYVKELQARTGLEQPVADYVFSFPQSVALKDKLCDLVQFLIPLFQEEGKNQLVIAVGCTGGKHRSVAIAEKIGEAVRAIGERAAVSHRDIKK